MAKTWVGRGTGGPTAASVILRSGPPEYCRAQVRNSSQRSYTDITSAENRPPLAVSTSTAPSSTARLSRPSRLRIRMERPSGCAIAAGWVVRDLGGEVMPSAGEQGAVVADEVPDRAGSVPGEVGDGGAHVLRGAGREHGQHLGEVAGLPVAEAPGAGGVPGLLCGDVHDLDVDAGLLGNDRGDLCVGRRRRAGEDVVPAVVPGIGQHRGRRRADIGAVDEADAGGAEGG